MWSVSRAARTARRLKRRSRFAGSPTNRSSRQRPPMRARSKSKGSLLLGLTAMGFVWGCGGHVTAEDRDGGALQDAAESVGFSDAARSGETVVSGSPDSAPTGPTPTVDAASPTARDGASAACTQMGGAGGSGVPGECSSTFGEMCGGTSYQVSCTCPRGTCVCFGLSTTVVSFTGCPSSCPGFSPGPTTDDIFALCGFPH